MQAALLLDSSWPLQLDLLRLGDGRTLRDTVSLTPSGRFRCYPCVDRLACSNRGNPDLASSYIPLTMSPDGLWLKWTCGVGRLTLVGWQTGRSGAVTVAGQWYEETTTGLKGSPWS